MKWLGNSIVFVFIILVIAGCTSKVQLDSDIHTIESFSDAMPYLQDCTAQTLILFDIDDVLINPVDMLARSSTVPALFTIKALLRFPHLVLRKHWENYYSTMWQQGRWYVIEPMVVDIIKMLKQQSCVVLALSSMETGKFGCIASFPQWRFHLLKKHGFEWTDTLANVVFTSLPAYRQNFPELYNGILCCNQQSKGAVVSALLDFYAYKPSKIIFFEDQKSNLSSVAQIARKRNIPFIGFLYTRGKNGFVQWDEKRALFQLDHLIKHNEWISDQDSSGYLNNKKNDNILRS